MSKRYEIRFAGSGGQGLVLAGVILAEAAIYEDKYVAQSQSYGPEARGGASKSEVIISDEEIDYPKAISLDVLLSLNQESCDKYYKDIKENGYLLVDSDLVKRYPSGKLKTIGLPFTKTAVEKAGKAMFANVVALGAVVELTGIMGRESVGKALLARVPKGTEEANSKALHAGFELIRSPVKGSP